MPTVEKGGSWLSAPPHVQATVNAIYGDDVYGWAGRQWGRVLASHPDVVLRSWYRPPEKQEALRRAGAPAARYSQHPLGLAIDVVPRRREQFILDARAAGFHVIPERGWIHLQAIQPQRFRQLLPALRSAGIWGRGR